MISEDIIMAVCADLANQVRGKGFPAKERDTRVIRGVGWVPTNSLITCFNSIADGPFGSVGDLLLVPDERAEVRVDFDDGSAPEHFIIGDIRTLDGAPWSCCPRSILQSALDDLLAEAGLQLKVAFEHEFWCSVNEATNEATTWSSFGLGSFRHSAQFGQTLLAALRLAGLEPDTFLPEFGSDQYEVTVSPSIGLRAADECVIVREMVRAVAKRTGHTVSFSPIVNEEAGNGLHIHISLVDRDGAPCTYEAGSPSNLNKLAGSFFGGIRKYLPSILALTASSVVSYERLKPHRWSAAYNNFAEKDREAALRVCPVIGLAGFDAESQLHVEYRAADATANPYLQLAVLTRDGLQGIRDNGPAPTPTTGDLSLLTDDQLAKIGVVRLSSDLPSALDVVANEPMLRSWLSSEFVDVFLAHKAGEIAFLKGKDASDIRRLYVNAY